MARVRRDEVWSGTRLLRISAAIGLLVFTPAPAAAQSDLNRLQGPPLSASQPVPASDNDILRKEKFRRRAAEAAQKQLEQLAEQFREQLVLEVAARKAAEDTLRRTLKRNKLTDQIDEERQRLRGDQIETLEAARDTLEQQILQLSRRLTDEAARRQTLEEQLQQVGRAVPNAAAGNAKLDARIKQLEQHLNAEKWARRLSEAQLQLLQARLAKSDQ